MAMIRLTFFVPSDVLERYDALVYRSGVRRSQLLREALEHGLAGVRAALPRLRARYGDGRSARRRNVVGAVDSSERADAANLDIERRLVRVGRMLVGREPDISAAQLRAALDASVRPERAVARAGQGARPGRRSRARRFGRGRTDERRAVAVAVVRDDPASVVSGLTSIAGGRVVRCVRRVGSALARVSGAIDAAPCGCGADLGGSCHGCVVTVRLTAPCSRGARSRSGRARSRAWVRGTAVNRTVPLMVGALRTHRSAGVACCSAGIVRRVAVRLRWGEPRSSAYRGARRRGAGHAQRVRVESDAAAISCASGAVLRADGRFQVAEADPDRHAGRALGRTRSARLHRQPAPRRLRARRRLAVENIVTDGKPCEGALDGDAVAHARPTRAEQRVSRAWLLCMTRQSRAASRGRRCVPAPRLGLRPATLRRGLRREFRGAGVAALRWRARRHRAAACRTTNRDSSTRSRWADDSGPVSTARSVRRAESRVTLRVRFSRRVVGLFDDGLDTCASRRGICSPGRSDSYAPSSPCSRSERRPALSTSEGAGVSPCVACGGSPCRRTCSSRRASRGEATRVVCRTPAGAGVDRLREPRRVPASRRLVAIGASADRRHGSYRGALGGGSRARRAQGPGRPVA